MVAKGASRQSSANAGELDRALSMRVDIKQFYSAGLAYHNCEPVPQSGFENMPGTVDLGPVRRRMNNIALTGPTPNLGPHTGTQTVWSGTVAGNVAAVVFSALSANTGTHTLWVEVNVGGVWTAIGPTVSLTTTPRYRTFAFAPGQGKVATAVRVRVTFGSSATVALTFDGVLTETSTLDRPRYLSLRHDSGDRYFMSLQPLFLDIWRDDTWVAGLFLPNINGAVWDTTSFYAENATVGIFQNALATNRVRRMGAFNDWVHDSWPYSSIPTEDLGGTYPKVDDIWEIFLNWSAGGSDLLYMTVTVDGEATPAIYLDNGLGTPVTVQGGTGDWPGFAADLQTQLQALPSLGAGVTVAQQAHGANGRQITITFDGAQSGVEYQVDPQITNTAQISALPVHFQIGETQYEPIMSVTAGYPGVAGLVQDRLVYGDLLSVPSALAVSAAAEYFDLNIESQSPSAARLDKLRAGESAERVLAIHDATFMLVFTDVKVHFAANRTISRDQPLNFTETSDAGIVPNTEPIDLGGKVYYVANNPNDEDAGGHQVLSLSYDELVTKFNAVPESLLSSHLVENIVRTKRQKSQLDKDAARMWMMRSDGLLVCGQVIASQDILGFCRWYAAAEGLVREIHTDARNDMRICVERGGDLRHERMDPALFLHAVITSTSDLAGVVGGLGLHEGREVWALAEGFVLGPFTVDDAEITLDKAYTGDVLVGLFQPPKFECMPRWHILPNDQIVSRPGRIHTANINVIDTTSIAVGANGQTPRNVSLARIGDPADGPTPAATRKLTVAGMKGAVEGTTLVITQTRPGKLRVRDYLVEEKL